MPKRYAVNYAGGSLSLENPLRLHHPILIKEVYVPIIIRDSFNPYVLKNIRICRNLEEGLQLLEELEHNYKEAYETLLFRLF